jgi:hypothetical protein
MSESTLAPARETRQPQRNWARWVFRIVVTIAALFTFAQAPLAGAFLAGHYDMLALHKDNSTIVDILSVVMTVTAVLVWRPGRGPGWLPLVSVVVLAAVVVQTVLGYQRSLTIHIPLGVLVIAAMIMLLVWAWRPVRTTTVEPS